VLVRLPDASTTSTVAEVPGVVAHTDPVEPNAPDEFEVVKLYGPKPLQKTRSVEFAANPVPLM
jgi:hypothetical protein